MLKQLLKRNLLLGLRHYHFQRQPAYVDWREKGAILPIKDQGQMNSCAAFAAINCVEALHKIATGNLIALSEQQLLDCVKTPKCRLSNPTHAFEHIVKHGISSAAVYPFRGDYGTCDMSKEKTARIDDWDVIPMNNEMMLKKVVARQPVAAMINGSNPKFWRYEEGIYREPSKIEDMDHFLSIVGNGITSDGEEYLIGRNSWGEGWGDKGYIKIAMNFTPRQGFGNMAYFASYPQIEGVTPLRRRLQRPMLSTSCYCKICAPHLHNSQD